MAILIGVDEAGYGPNYGPLVIAATAWSVEERSQESAVGGQESRSSSRGSSIHAESAGSSRRWTIAPPAPDVDLYTLLAGAVVRSPAECSRRLAIADSKALYKHGGRLRQLERGVLAALALLQRSAASFGDLLAATQADPLLRRRDVACHADDGAALPVELPADDLQRAAALLDGVCRTSGVALLALRARLVYPAEFNELVDEFRSKGAALSHVTLALVRQLIESLPTPHGPPLTFVGLDKHGGRTRYGSLVQHHFPEGRVEVVVESRTESRYHWEHAGRAIEASFRVKCEELLPTALASMAAKYHRELAMRAFNAFWSARVPGLWPTSGYPQDAPRFKADIAAAQRDLGIEDRLIWRSR